MAQLRYVLLAVTLVVLIGVSAVAVNVPNTFVAGETIRASEVNANFAALEAAVTALVASQPVVAHARAAETFFAVDSAAVAEDVVVVSLDAPAAGAVIVTATAQTGFFDTTQPNRFVFAIDDVGGGNLTGEEPGQFYVGSQTPPNTDLKWSPVAIQRAFEVGAGVHAFRLKAQAKDLNGTKWLWSSTITATWYPAGSASIAATTLTDPVAPMNAR